MKDEEREHERESEGVERRKVKSNWVELSQQTISTGSASHSLREICCLVVRLSRFFFFSFFAFFVWLPLLLFSLLLYFCWATEKRPSHLHTRTRIETKCYHYINKYDKHIRNNGRTVIKINVCLCSIFSLRDYVTNKKTGQQLNKLFSLSLVCSRACVCACVCVVLFFLFELKHQINERLLWCVLRCTKRSFSSHKVNGFVEAPKRKANFHRIKKQQQQQRKL